MKFINILSNVKNYFHKNFIFYKVHPAPTLEFRKDYIDILCRQCGCFVQYDPFEDFCLFECRLCSMVLR